MAHAPPALTLMENVAVVWFGVGVALSVAWITMLRNVPLCDGVPLMTPAEFMEMPVGNDPLSLLHVTAPVPPVLVRVTGPYADPMVPPGSGVEVVIRKPLKMTVITPP